LFNQWKKIGAFLLFCDVCNTAKQQKLTNFLFVEMSFELDDIWLINIGHMASCLLADFSLLSKNNIISIPIVIRKHYIIIKIDPAIFQFDFGGSDAQ
jgi:hypothetical protein